MGSLTTNTSIHTLSEIIEDPQEEYLNSILQEKTNDASSSKKVMTNILNRLADMNKQNNDDELDINVTEENQQSPERSPKPTDNEDNEREDELSGSPAKRIKMDKSE